MHDFDLFFNVSRFVPGGPSYFGGRNDHSAAYEYDGIVIATVSIGLYLPFLLSVLTARRGLTYEIMRVLYCKKEKN